LKKLPAYTVYLVYAAATALFYGVVFTFSQVYLVEEIGLGPFQLVLVGTALEGAVFLFEVPTGVVADVYSRRLSIIIGVIVIGAGFGVMGVWGAFAGALLGQALWGLGYTFTSGAVQAWIVDEIGEDRAGEAFLRGSQAAQIGSFGGIFIAMLLAGASVRVPIVAGGAAFIGLAAFLALFMPERRFTPIPREERETWGDMARTFKDGLRAVRGRPVLMTLLAAMIVFGAFSESYDRLWTPHLTDNVGLPPAPLDLFEPLQWFGVISLVKGVLGLIAAEVVRRRLNTNDPALLARFMLVNNALIVGAVIVFALATGFPVALAAIWIISPLRAVGGPIGETLLNRYAESRVRATVISMSGQMDALGQIVGGPIFGAVAQAAGIPAGMLVGAAVLLVVLPLYARAARQARIPKQEAA
jgi:DHA3 family tetracycline resistance protein-like MFS transporter